MLGLRLIDKLCVIMKELSSLHAMFRRVFWKVFEFYKGICHPSITRSAPALAVLFAAHATDQTSCQRQ
jgi:hypothetical protein